MEAAQLLRTWLTDWRQSFGKWALIRHTTEVFKDFVTRASIEAKPQYGTKWRLLNISGLENLCSVPKKCPFGETLTPVSQPVPE